MNGFSIYQETAISTQNRGRLIVMLYDGAIKFLRQAVEDLKRGDLAAKGRHIGKAQDILFELNTVLDMEKGGQIAQNLRALYNFMQRHLTEANIRKDPKMIEEVIALLEELNQSWRAVCG
ncbi:MAG TPA: flagellar export chaperone FliS [Anaerohalosphaeraceae bacterium]|mgnify:FL=1|jgi:flagellar protein FliS|nr:flagellar export chaperone FliS [Phycisphaerae bacterium]HOT73652.1 flagellar export chaperone FliS [Anaerohalosphaeraceae bacterium]HQG06929.1 flagellar export chaperone FliS [Anaerohalosphaeraceae bacterium]HQI08299.1 flagellar export chaperone FliS [Anaerohalosphaeraceae bacterium]HQJ68630.1 flagellar export chaperone FliS [Anaerohalosphaeraceae bacterium]